MAKRKMFPSSRRKSYFKPPRVKIKSSTANKKANQWTQAFVIGVIILVIYLVLSSGAPSVVKDDATATATRTPRPTATVTLTRTPRPTATEVICPNINATCGQLTCAEARACLAAGNASLDGDGDGQPCESNCR